ncbi:N-acetylmuramoyl-L-alanine amidase [Streptomyces sp. NPDC058385]|uniref:N-acetylmuramoyl-L-alanine amidase n=1 Tax=Streptomyces sp. NPDC058385 TaxID=3346473 RepID=UPI003653013C
MWPGLGTCPPSPPTTEHRPPAAGLVDKCGNTYEGRAGGTDHPVIGSHAIGFNQGTAGIAAIGTFGQKTPLPAAMERGIAALAAWKPGLRGIDPTSKVRLTSTNDKSRYTKETSAIFNAIADHRDGFATDCPGEALFARVPAIRRLAADLQDRSARTLFDADAPVTWRTLRQGSSAAIDPARTSASVEQAEATWAKFGLLHRRPTPTPQPE